MPVGNTMLYFTVRFNQVMGGTGQDAWVNRMQGLRIVPEVEAFHPCLGITRIIHEVLERQWLGGIRVVIHGRALANKPESFRSKSGQQSHPVKFRDCAAVRKRDRRNVFRSRLIEKT